MKQLFLPLIRSGLVLLSLWALPLLAIGQGTPVTCSGQDAAGQPAAAGLYAEYYAGYFDDDQAFFASHTASLVRTDATVNFDAAQFGAIVPPAQGNIYDPNYFSVRLRGSLLVPQSGTYTLSLTSDDAGYVWLDNEALASPPSSATAIINNGGQGYGTTITTVYLTAGAHNLLIHYGEATGGNTLQLRWASTDAGIAEQIIPSTSLCTGLQPLRSIPQALTYAPDYNVAGIGTVISSGTPTVTSDTPVLRYILTNAASLPAGITIDAATGVLTANATVPVGKYRADVSAVNEYGQNTFTRVFTFLITPPPPAGISGTDPGGHPAAQGLYIEYYPGNFNFATDLNAYFAQTPARSFVVSEVNLVDNWGNILPPATGSRFDPDNFSARLRASVLVPVTGSYMFYLTADDGALLWLDNDALDATLDENKVAIDNGGSHPPKTKTVRRFLTAGLHNVTILYGEGSGGNTLQLEWSSTAAGIARQIIPASSFGTPMQRRWQLPTASTYLPISKAIAVTGTGASNVPTVTTPLPATGFALANAEDLPAGITIDNATGALQADATVPQGSYQADVAVINAEGAATFSRAFSFVITPPPPVGCTGPDPGGNTVTAGLYGEYYAGYFDDLPNNQNFFSATTPSMLRTELGLDFVQDDWGPITGATLDAQGTPNFFSARFRGRLYVPVTGTYTLALTSDDASYLWLDQEALATPPSTAAATINNGTGHAPRTITATVTLSAGLHPILVHYGEFTNSNRLSLSWQSADAGIPDLVAIPATQLCTGLGIGTLPVELVRFQARPGNGGIVNLNWETAQEKNNAYFAVERSADGQHFTEIGRQAGAGSSTQQQRYQFVDRSPGAGVNYYRLRQMDLDGSVHYSSVQAVQLAGRQGLALNVFPNPTSGEFVVRLSQPEAAAATLEVLDLQGRRLYTQQLVAQSTGEYRIHVPSLRRGAYLVRLLTRSGTTTQKLLVE